jgi:G3E family GTPase
VDFKEHENCHHDDDEHDHGHKHDEHDCGHKHDDGHKHDEHDHAHGHGHEGESQKKKKKTHNLSLVSSVGFTIQGLLDVPKFNGFMSQLLQAKAADLYRTKGVLAFADQGDAKFVFQGE